MTVDIWRRATGHQLLSDGMQAGFDFVAATPKERQRRLIVRVDLAFHLERSLSAQTLFKLGQQRRPHATPSAVRAHGEVVDVRSPPVPAAYDAADETVAAHGHKKQVRILGELEGDLVAAVGRPQGHPGTGLAPQGQGALVVVHGELPDDQIVHYAILRRCSCRPSRSNEVSSPRKRGSKPCEHKLDSHFRGNDKTGGIGFHIVSIPSGFARENF